jgi:hypothetical protein
VRDAPDVDDERDKLRAEHAEVDDGLVELGLGRVLPTAAADVRAAGLTRSARPGRQR